MARDRFRLALLILDALSFLCAIAAAGFWYAASIDSTPQHVLQTITELGGTDIFGSDVKELVRSLVSQGEMNTRAAEAAAAAAALQGAAIVIRAVRERLA